MGAGSLVLLLALPLAAAPLSPFPRHVRNEGALSMPAESRLEESLAAFERDSGRRFYVAALDSAGTDGLRELARGLAREWKADLLLVYAKDERRWRVEVGPGVEPTLGDAEARMTVDGAAQSWFDQNDVDAAIEVGAAALAARLEGRLGPPRAEPGAAAAMPLEALVGSGVLLLLVLIITLARPRDRYGRLTRRWDDRGGIADGDAWGGGGTSGSW